MLLSQGISMAQKQKLILTPELKRALKILQMPILELSQFTELELAENPFLEMLEEEPEEEDVLEEVWELAQSDFEQQTGSSAAQETKMELWQKNAMPTLYQYLEDQLYNIKTTDEEWLYCCLIIDSLDDNGYLTETIENLAKIMQKPVELFKKALALIQTFDPRGVGACNLQECLLLQVEEHRSPLIVTIIREYLEEVATGRIKEIAKKTKKSLQDVQAAVDFIKTLNPRPGNGFRKEENLGHIFPDITVKKVGDDYLILINEGDTPRLMISPFYSTLLKNYKDGQEKEFVHEKLHRAVLLLKNIEQRKMTMTKVAEALFEMQKDFLLYGPEHLKPLTQKEIALQVDLHESTISRVVSSKYCQTDWGVYPLSYFFPSKVNDCSTGQDDLTAEKIKKVLKRIIRTENPQKPWSDQKIQDLLAKEDIEIARRTVAKYREELGIPASSKRKRY